MAKLLNQRRSRSSQATARYFQLALPCRGRGGYRPGSGRPRSGRSGIPHRKRPVLAAVFPVHVTLRVRAGLPSLRLPESRRVFVAAIAAARDRFGCRIVHYSIQSNHVHLICEANDQVSLSRGLRGLVIRMARGFNRVHALRGAVWADRYHERILRTPREVRAVLVYVLGNWRHQWGRALSPWVHRSLQFCRLVRRLRRDAIAAERAAAGCGGTDLAIGFGLSATHRQALGRRRRLDQEKLGLGKACISRRPFQPVARLGPIEPTKADFHATGPQGHPSVFAFSGKLPASWPRGPRQERRLRPESPRRWTGAGPGPPA